MRPTAFFSRSFWLRDSCAISDHRSNAEATRACTIRAITFVVFARARTTSLVYSCHLDSAANTTACEIRRSEQSTRCRCICIVDVISSHRPNAAAILFDAIRPTTFATRERDRTITSVAARHPSRARARPPFISRVITLRARCISPVCITHVRNADDML